MIFAKVLVHLLKDEAPTFFTDRWFDHLSKQLDFDMKVQMPHNSLEQPGLPR